MKTRSILIVPARNAGESFTGDAVDITGGGDEINLWFKSSPCDTATGATITMRIESSHDGETFSGIPGAEFEVESTDADFIGQLDMRLAPSTRYLRASGDVTGGGEFVFSISAFTH